MACHLSPPAAGSVLLLALIVVARVGAWQKWDYKSTPSEDWKDQWGYEVGPRGRRGHSISMIGSKLVMFGGRDNEIQRQHVPKTYVSLGGVPRGLVGKVSTRPRLLPNIRPCKKSSYNPHKAASFY